MNIPFPERRAHYRFTVKNNILLYNEITFAEIINISKGGTWCRFIMESRDQHTTCTSIDLLNTAEKFYVQGLHCRDLSSPEPSTIESTPASAIIRDCRLQFVNLADTKKKQLDTFIELGATDRA